MKEMLKVFETNDGSKAVSARELHEQLGVGRDFSTWIGAKIKKYGFAEDVDYALLRFDFDGNLLEDKLPHSGGLSARPYKTEYVLSLDCAKEIAMVENNETGRQIRKYLIRIENDYWKKGLGSLSLMTEVMSKLSESVAELSKSVAGINERINNLEQKSLGEGTQLLTIGEYAMRENLPVPRAKAIEYGRICTAHCRNNNIQMGQVFNKKYINPLNSYPVDVLKMFVK